LEKGKRNLVKENCVRYSITEDRQSHESFHKKRENTSRETDKKGKKEKRNLSKRPAYVLPKLKIVEVTSLFKNK